MVKRSSKNQVRSEFTIDALRVVEMMPVRVVEIVPVLVVEMVPAAVVEIVPVLVVEIVPVLVVEIMPPLAKVGADMARTNIVAHTVDLRFFIVLLLVLETFRGKLVGSEALPAKPFPLGRLTNN